VILKVPVTLQNVSYVFSGPAEVDNDWSGRTSGFYGRYFQKEAQKDYRVSSGVLLKIEVVIR